MTMRRIRTSKTASLLATLVAGISAGFLPLHAQGPGLPPGFSVEEGQKPAAAPAPALRVPSGGFPPAEPLKLLETKTFPYQDSPLRDPFWAVGYFPAQWGAKPEPEKQKLSASEWRVPTSQIKVSGVSRMGGRVMAIINGDLKKVGDVIEIAYLGKVFQWKVAQIQPDGNVQFERHEIITDASGSATQ